MNEYETQSIQLFKEILQELKKSRVKGKSWDCTPKEILDPNYHQKEIALVKKLISSSKLKYIGTSALRTDTNFPDIDHSNQASRRMGKLAKIDNMLVFLKLDPDKDSSPWFLTLRLAKNPNDDNIIYETKEESISRVRRKAKLERSKKRGHQLI